MVYPLASRGTVKPMTPVSGVRVATVIAVGFGGIVLLAIGLGAVAGRLATPGRVFLVATLVTTAAAFAGGILAEPVLRRWAARPCRGRSGRLRASTSRASVALLERPPGRSDGHSAARGDAGQSDDLGYLPRAEVREQPRHHDETG